MSRRKPDRDALAEGLDPSLARGLTIGTNDPEEIQELTQPKAPISGVEIIAHMTQEKDLPGTRQPRPHFVVDVSDKAVWMDGATDRLWMDVNKTYTPDGIALLRQGRQCLRCDEPQLVPFPAQCDLCGYAMADRQIMDMAMEFEGQKHLGPSKPMSEYLAEEELKAEKKKFARSIKEGKSPMRGLRGADRHSHGP